MQGTAFYLLRVLYLCRRQIQALPEIYFMNILIGEKKDLPRFLELIKELATFEKALREVIISLALAGVLHRQIFV